MTFHFLVVFLAVLIDRFVGDPPFLWRRIPHPVVWFGWLINGFDKMLNRQSWSNKARFYCGWLTIIVLLFIASVVGIFIHILCLKMVWFGVLVEALIGSIFLAQKSLFQHVRAVFEAFKTDGLIGARHAVSMIVGRDPQKLDGAGVASSAIESLAENTSDGIVAPVFWFAIFGLPGLFAYKILNTADSMIAHMSERYRDFGYATAKLDDIANYIPARLTAFLVLFVVLLKSGKGQCHDDWQIIKQDAKHHRSPNAGWPETAFAAALNIRLSGPRSYDGHISQEPYLHENGNIASKDDIPKALKLFESTMTVLLIIVGLFMLIAYFLAL